MDRTTEDSPPRTKMTTPNRLPRAEAALREHALAYPESYEEFPWGHRAIKVQKKTFLFLYRDAKQLSMSVKLPVSGRMALSLSFASPTEYGLGSRLTQFGMVV
jgi:hypothetical protein